MPPRLMMGHDRWVGILKVLALTAVALMIFGAVAVAADGGLTSLNIGRTSIPQLGIELAFPNLPGFEDPVLLVNANDQSNRIFVATRDGEIWSFENNPAVSSATSFLEISDKVGTGSFAQGYLGLAFDPNYSENGYFYVYHTKISGTQNTLSRYTVSDTDPDKADPDSELVILEPDNPFHDVFEHSGGTLIFGDDGMLYLSLGYGATVLNPIDTAQDLTLLLGSILRLDVSNATVQEPYQIPPDNPFVDSPQGERGEIWAYGLRNPWKISFDPNNGALWATDVGSNKWEEIDIIEKGGNYGWRIMEGALLL